MVLCCLLNRGDSLLCDEYTYSHLVEAMVRPKGYNAIPVPMDDFGMTPESLDKVSSESCCYMVIGHVRAYVRVRTRACVCACVRACVRARVCVCVCVVANLAASIKLPCDTQACPAADC